MENLGQRIKAERDSRGWSQKELARRVTRAGFKIGQAGIAQIERRGSSEPKCIIQLAEALGVLQPWLQFGREPKFHDVASAAEADAEKPHSAPLPEDQPPNATALIDSPFPLPQRERMPRDIPLLGISVGGHDGEFTLNGEPVDYVRRPGGLMHRKGVFAVTVSGNSMLPWRKNRMPVFVDQYAKPEIGDHVVIELKGDPKPCYVKLLVKRTEKHVIVSQYNPPKEITFPRASVHHIYRCIEWEEAIGLGT